MHQIHPNTSETPIQVEANAPFGLFNIDVERDLRDGEPVIRLLPTFADWAGPVDFSVQEIDQFIERLEEARRIAEENAPIRFYPVDDTPPSAA